ncbi:hypothetical protein VTK56DRAFT_6296 [Thermocarpiscus australiensis]
MDFQGLLRGPPKPSNGCVGTKSGDRCLNDDVWHLILRYLRPKDLFSVCLVSKRLHHLAIPHMYHTIVVQNSSRKKRKKQNTAQQLIDVNNRHAKSRLSPWDESLSLIRRLAGQPHGEQARAVHEVEINPFKSAYDARDLTHGFDGEELVPDVKNALAMLVKALPNIRHFRLWSPTPGIDDLICALNHHHNRPRLHLLHENGSRAVTCQMPSVTTIRAVVNPYYVMPDSDQPNRRMLELQNLFFACPNLKSFSVSVYGNWGGCVIRTIPLHIPRYYWFKFTGHETFPSKLESLSLDGYRMVPDEWIHWREKLNWSNLTSLSLGPQRSTELLELFRGHTTAVRSLTVETWAGEGDDHYPQLEEFLLSFGSLEQLTVRGHFVSNRALGHHPRLKRLCLHAIEVQRGGAPRPTLSVDDLRELDANCPDLEVLEIDIDRDSSGWPQEIIKILASGFPNLQHLALHLEVGIDFDKGWNRQLSIDERILLPMLDADLARAFAQPFFAWRQPGSKLKMLTLRTGEKLRRFPQWPPAYQDDERMRAVTIHVCAPSCPDGKLAMDIIDWNDSRSCFFRWNMKCWSWSGSEGSDSES